MFRGATSFDQNIGNWNLNPENILSSDETNNGVGGLWQMFSEGSGLSTENYDSTLIGFLNFVQENNISLERDLTQQWSHILTETETDNEDINDDNVEYNTEDDEGDSDNNYSLFVNSLINTHQ